MVHRIAVYTFVFLFIAVSVVAQDTSPPGAASLQDAASYAARYGVGVDEAIRRLKLQREAGDLDAALSAEERATFAGLWIEHTPRYRVVVRFTDRASEARLQARLAKGPLADLVETLPARWTLAQLESHQAESRAAARRAGVRINSDVNVFENRVELHVLDPQELLSMRVHLPPSVEITRVRELARPQAVIDGGSPLSTCTAGFTVVSPNYDMGVLTAGHCADQQSFQGIALPFRGQDVSGDQDVQWHSTCDLVQASNLFNSGIDLRPVLATRSRSYQPLGQFLCKFGKATGRTCGTIYSKSYDPGYAFNGTFVYVKGGTVNLSEEGDSGAPWFVENDAYGIQSGGVGNDAYYMAINYVSTLGVSVLTAPPPAGQCNTPPQASFTMARRFDGTVTFDASASSDPDGRIVRYDWDFGDGTTGSSTSPVIAHVYPRETNSYWIVLTVTDNEGKRASAVRELLLCYPLTDCREPIQ